MIGAAAPALLGHLPAASFDAVYAAGPDVISAGTFNPTGTATPVDGGFRVSGRWSFASGSLHAHWFLAHCFVDDGRVPPLRMMVLPAADVEIVDTWSTIGLLRHRQSRLHHRRRVRRRAAGRFRSSSRRKLDFPLMRIPELCLSTMAFAAVAVGIASGALDEIIDSPPARLPMFADDDPWRRIRCFATNSGEPARRCGGARDALRHSAEDAWSMALAGRRFDDARRAGVAVDDDVGRRDRRPQSSTRRTAPVVERRSTSVVRCSAGCATSTRSPSTSASSSTRSRSPARCSPARRSTPASCDAQHGDRWVVFMTVRS